MNKKDLLSRPSGYFLLFLVGGFLMTQVSVLTGAYILMFLGLVVFSDYQRRKGLK